jgi:ferric-dicitrate binding protein FerR (iron transport regulator)
MKTENKEVIIQIITKYLAGSADNGEIINLGKWINDSEENKKYFEQLKNIWETTSKDYFPKNIKTDKALENVLQRISGRSHVRKLWFYWEKIAAVLLIPLLFGSIIWFNHGSKSVISSTQPVYSEVYATFGTRTALKLIDGTLVWLNSGTSLRYPDKFVGKQRNVYLNGEASFEVANNASMPFNVQTSSLSIKATGTKFDVSDYSSDFKSEVILVSGKIFVNKLDTNGTNRLLSELNPNQHLVFNRHTKTFSLNDEDTYKYIAWKEGKLVFRNEPMNEVVKKLSQVFNVDIELKGSALQNYCYRATFQEESLNEILKLLKMSSPIDFLEVKRFPQPDGTFPRKKVIIFPAQKD